MSDRDIQIVLNARDNLSPVLAKAGASAGKLSSGLEQAGSRGARGLQAITRGSTEATRALDAIERNTAETVRALDRLDQSGQKTQRSFDGMKRSGAALGAAATSLMGALSGASRAAAEESAIFARLETQVEANGDSFDAYATRVDEAVAAGQRLAFADDQVAAGLTNLAQTTGSTEKAMANIGLAMDLARGKGLDLATASTIVGKVAEGNTAILQRYGVTVAEGASAQAALAELQARFANQATTYAESNAGALDRWKNSADNLFESVGAATGPLQTTLAILPGLSAGYTLVGGAAGAAGDQLGIVGTKATAAAVGQKALGLALGPAGIAGAAALAGVAIYELVQRYDAIDLSAEEVAASADDITAALVRMQEAGASASTLETFRVASEFVMDIGRASNDAETRIGAVNRELVNQQQILGQMRGSFEGVYTSEQIAAQEALVAGLHQQQRALDGAIITNEQYSSTLQDLNVILGDASRINYPQLVARVEELNQQFSSGQINADQYDAAIGDLKKNVETYGLTLDDIAPKQEKIAQAQDRVTAAQQRGAEMLGALGNAYGEATAANEQMVADLQAEEEAAAELAATFQSALVPGIDGASAALAGLAGPGADALDVLRNMVEASSGMQAAMQDLGDSALFRADTLNDTAETLDRVISRFETLDALGQRTAGVESIATNLIGNPGEWATIDDLLAAGEISLSTYYAAVEAGTRIQGDNKAVQEDLNAIRAAQLPGLERASEAYQEEIYHISLLEPKQQALALAYLDTANQQKLMELSSLAAAAAAGELGTNGVEAANTIAQAALDADPALKALALDAGLATQDREGNITLNTEGADTAINELTRSIDALTTTLGGVPPVRVPVEVGEVDLTLPQGTAIDPLKAPVEVGNVDLSIPAGLAIDPLKAPVVLDVPSTTELAAMLPPSPPPIEAKVRILGDDGQFQDVMGRTNLAVDDFGNKVTSTAITADNGQLVEVVYDSEGRLLTIGGMAVTPQMLADNSMLVTQYDASMGLLSILDGSTGTVLYQGDATGAINAGGQAAAARNNVDGTGATIYIRGDNSGVYAAANAVNGAVLGTAYIAIRGIRSGFQEFAHGGTVLPTAANGRTTLVGEYGPELVNLPYGSQVTPHGASMSALQNSSMMRTMRDFSDSVEKLEGAADDFVDAVVDLSGAVGRWERVNDTQFRNTQTGAVQQGIRAEDDTYVNPDFYSSASDQFKRWSAYNEARPATGNAYITWTQWQARGMAHGGTSAVGRWEEIDIGDAVNYRNTQTGAIREGIRAEDNSYVNPDFYRHLGEGIERNPAGGLRVTRGSMFEMWQKYLRETGNYDAAHNFDWFKRAYPHGYAHGGTAWGDGRTLVGEYGAEMLTLPSGAQVTPHGASMSKLESDRQRAGRGRDGGVHFHGTVNLQPASTNVHDSIRAAALTRARY